MKRFLSKTAIFLFPTLVLSVVFYAHNLQAAFGASPPWVENNNVLPGSTHKQTVYLSRSNTEETLKASIRVSGDEALKKWVSVPDIENLVMEKGEKMQAMEVLVQVPENAENGRYVGGIFVTMAPLKQESQEKNGEVGITVGASIAVDITVTGTEPLPAEEPLEIERETEIEIETPAEEPAPSVEPLLKEAGEKIEAIHIIDYIFGIAAFTAALLEYILQL